MIKFDLIDISTLGTWGCFLLTKDSKITFMFVLRGPDHDSKD